jgi:hypothetical protein
MGNRVTRQFILATPLSSSLRLSICSSDLLCASLYEVLGCEMLERVGGVYKSPYLIRIDAVYQGFIEPPRHFPRSNVRMRGATFGQGELGPEGSAASTIPATGQRKQR